MYFSTFNHYDDDDNDYHIQSNNEVCLICWDASTHDNNSVYKMQSLLETSLYFTTCSCNGSFHQNCLLKWIYKTYSCPICRTKFEIDVDKKLPLTFNIFKILKLFKLLFMRVLIKIIYDITFNIQVSLESHTQNEQCIQN